MTVQPMESDPAVCMYTDVSETVKKTSPKDRNSFYFLACYCVSISFLWGKTKSHYWSTPGGNLGRPLTGKANRCKHSDSHSWLGTDILMGDGRPDNYDFRGWLGDKSQLSIYLMGEIQQSFARAEGNFHSFFLFVSNVVRSVAVAWPSR